MSLVITARPGGEPNTTAKTDRDTHSCLNNVEVLAEGLVALGLMKGRASNIIKKERYRKFYVHRTGHWLGMDVHDVGDYKIEGEWRVLEPGMVMTISMIIRTFFAIFGTSVG